CRRGLTTRHFLWVGRGGRPWICIWESGNTSSRSRSMSAPPKIRDWWHQVRYELLPEAHGHQVNALAELSFAMAMAEHCQGGKISSLAPGEASPASVERRLERLVANDRL